KPASESLSLDVDATVDAIEAALTSGKHQVTLVTQRKPTAISDASAQQTANQAAALIKEPLEVDWAGGKTQILPGNLASIMRFAPDTEHPDRFAISLDQDGLTSLLTSIAPQVETPAQNADLRYLDGKVVVKSPEKAGTQLAIGPSVNAVNAAVLAGKPSVTLATEPVQPTITAAMAGTISLPDVLASSKTYYGGAAANRAFNVELAVQRVNGALVPPGGTFSFDGSVGAIDVEHGYKLGYGIVGTTNGSVSTVPSVGGGVCQVSTTVFQSAFWAGLPIVQRSWHLYWIPTYGQPPSGLTGLDATVDTDVGLDLKFKNTTGHWIAISGYADGTWVNFEILGTNTGWDVQVDQPVITNVVQPPSDMEYEQSDALPAGQSLLVQAAQEGFDVDVHRVVTLNGKVLDDYHVKSHYLPAGNITLQGDG
ncbi:MAG TPA: VanW family protein, partial [Thermomicrobiaceae bacterium]|nr:VanW family protein [Thermomicrobiaceae bacterium]